MGVAYYMTKEVIAGCCGFPCSRSKYYSLFKAVEIQQTFYKIPSAETLRRWRDEAPEGFRFTMKAWQAISHPPSSPTWRKAGIKVEAEKADRYGYLRPTKENFDAWEKTLEAAKILGADVIVIQTPASFGYNEENLRNVIEFFSSITPSPVKVAWEPRGTWNEHPDILQKIFDEYGIIHAVDILRRKPVSRSDTLYVRLHGLGGKEVNYRYKYTDNDLRKLSELIIDEMNNKALGYVFFNNVYMLQDALRAREVFKQYGINAL